MNYIIQLIVLNMMRKRFNIFIDKTFDPLMIKTFIDTYKDTKNKNSLNLKIIFDDYTHIFNKKTYIDILINNLMNNFSEAKRLIIFKREHKKRHDKEDFEESKRINSEFYVTKSTSSNDNDKTRNSAIIANSNFNNSLQRKGNIAADRNKTKEAFKASLTFNKINSIKEEPEEDIDHLKQFNEKEKEKEKKKKTKK